MSFTPIFINLLALICLILAFFKDMEADNFLIFAAINVVGGFRVTDRMLEMFRSDKKAGKGAK